MAKHMNNYMINPSVMKYKKVNRNALINKLQKGVYQISDIKEDGSYRVFICTLDQSQFPVYPKKENYSARKDPDYLITVWDMVKNGYRRIMVNRILFIEKIG